MPLLFTFHNYESFGCMQQESTNTVDALSAQFRGIFQNQPDREDKPY